MTALLGVVGCTSAETPGAKVVTKPDKVLVVYYSRSGNTQYAAQQIQKNTGGTLFEIKPVKPYPAEYRKCTEQAKKEIQENFRPELMSLPENWDKYNVIFIGSPNWWGTMAPPVASFISSCKFSGKTVIPFFTNGGGGMQNCEKDVRSLLAKKQEQVKIIPAKTFSGSSVRSMDNAIAEWVKSIIILKGAK